jgi:hypothetical protein
MRRQALHLTRVAASALALCALLPILGGVALQSAPNVRAAGGCGTTQACIHWDGSMIYPGQNNGNPEGPVGEHALVHGEGFLTNAGQHVHFRFVDGDVNSPPPGTTDNYTFCKFVQPKVDIPGDVVVRNDGAFDFNFDIPQAAAAGAGDWSICAYGEDGLPAPTGVGNVDDGPFRVLTAGSPSIALSTNNTQPGQAVTITGKNWLPAQGGIFVYIGPCANCDSAPIVSTTLSSDASGNFSVSLPIPSNTAPATYIASAHNQSSVLDLINTGPHLTVAAAASTATTAPSPTATKAPTATATKASAGNGGGNTSASTGAGGSNTGLLIGLVVAIVVLLAALAGMLAYLATQRRNAAPGGPSGPNGPSGPGRYSPPFGANTNPAGRYGPPDPFAAPYHPPATPPPLPDWDPGATTNPGNDAPDDAPTQAGFFPPPADPYGR